MSVGGGFNSLEEFLSVFNIPFVMTQRSFVLTEQMIGKWWWKIFGGIDDICREGRKPNSNQQGAVSQ